jgi:uncharacterized protein (DUF58 family)
MREGVAPRESGSVFGFGISLVLLALLLLAAELPASGAASGVREGLAGFVSGLLILMLASRLWARASLARLELELDHEGGRAGRRVFAGEEFVLRFRVRNRKPLPVVVGLELSLPEGLALVEAPDVKGAALGPYERAELSRAVLALRRGVCRTGSAILSAGDMLGLHRRERTIGLEGEVVVFPRVFPIAEFEPPFRDYFGIHPSVGAIEDPAWYEGTREYSGQRPAKAIHWKASARLGILQEKIFEPTSQLKVVFLLDGGGFLASQDYQGLERALEVLASTASRFAEKGASFAVAASLKVRDYPASIGFGRGSEHLGALLELLARCEPEEGRPLLPLPAGIGSTSSGFVVVARSPDEGTKPYFALPASRHDRILFIFAEGAEGLAYPAISFGAAVGAES